MKQDWGNSNLADYLLYDEWEFDNAFRLLAGSDYKNNNLLYVIDTPHKPIKDLSSKIQRDLVEKNLARLEDFWSSGNKRRIPYSPSFFIEWALSKRFRPDWLDWAIEQGLYITRQDGIADKINPANNSKRYLTKWMEVQEGAIREFFNPRRNPDAKSEEVIEWINNEAKNIQLKESNNIAQAIFSIIKPENHDPKKKRVEPK
jgi:hypothetical protein